ncbi:hypothetical protein D515_01659 [Grimontia indica]|uniref:Uncharacterized protein n=1 Tax=Grimontia indica TaxID=1056512 RepID=R1IW98_9GAMM|nr:hypothetical protein D515_01659 [Grimontia indica]
MANTPWMRAKRSGVMVFFLVYKNARKGRAFVFGAWVLNQFF